MTFMDTQRLRHVVSVTMDVYDTAAVVIMTSLVDGSASRQWVTSALDPSYKCVRIDQLEITSSD